MKILITKLYGYTVSIVKELDENNRSTLYIFDDCYIDTYGRLHYKYANPNETEYEVINQ